MGEGLLTNVARVAFSCTCSAPYPYNDYLRVKTD